MDVQMEKIKGYVTELELKKGLAKLDCDQDKFLLLAIYNGITGKSGLSELAKLKVEDINFDKGIVMVEDRIITMDEELKKITKGAIEQKTYATEVFSKFGQEEYDLNTDSPYVLRVKPRAVNNWGVEPMTYNGLRTRIARILAKAGLDTTTSQLETSGIVNELLKEKEEWTVMDVEFSLRIKNIKANAYRIYNIIKKINA